MAATDPQPSPAERDEEIHAIAGLVDQTADRIANGDLADPMGDLADRCAHYYARSTGIPIDSIQAARKPTEP